MTVRTSGLAIFGFRVLFLLFFSFGALFNHDRFHFLTNGGIAAAIIRCGIAVAIVRCGIAATISDEGAARRNRSMVFIFLIIQSMVCLLMTCVGEAPPTRSMGE
ncbi:hypothetical protein VIGAN_11061400 [Vigna angularis var. angularis]|uniref:Uncharacterized protein n=1 Tax=Vigna angularis var. angularis TaxID=157739 RepID=A0A0S3T802_PHAAN|nr:hypothetical protein VIGAN_11061400 [Vigna angularis var. angularis]